MVENEKYIGDVKVEVIPKIGMSVSYRDGSKPCTGIICQICDNGKTILFKDSLGEIHMAKLSTRKNSTVRGQWIENGITRKICSYAFSHIYLKIIEK